MKYLFSLLFTSFLYGGVLPSQFEAAYQGNRIDLNADQWGLARSQKYVFVKGFLNEVLPGYFTENIDELKALGVPAKYIDVVAPPSTYSFNESIQAIHQAVQRASQNGSENVVVIAHSRGAVDALVWALHNPSVVQKNVRALFLIQGAFNGSPFADYLVREGIEIDGNMPQPFGTLLGIQRTLRQSLFHCLGTGLSELSTSRSQELWNRLERNFANAAQSISNKVNFIRGSAIADIQSPVLQPSGYYLETYYGENDGLTLLDRQSISWVGQVVLTGKTDHTDYTNSRPTSRGGREYRQSITRAMFDSAGRAF